MRFGLIGRVNYVFNDMLFCQAAQATALRIGDGDMSISVVRRSCAAVSLLPRTRVTGSAYWYCAALTTVIVVVLYLRFCRYTYRKGQEMT